MPGSVRGKGYKAIAYDIAEGYVTVNPLFLKPLDNEALKAIFQEIRKCQIEIRAEKFPYNDMQAIRMRNTRLQRLHTSTMVIANYAKSKKIILY